MQSFEFMLFICLYWHYQTRFCGSIVVCPCQFSLSKQDQN